MATVKILEDGMKRTLCDSPRQGPCTQSFGGNGPVTCDSQHTCFFSQGRCYNGECKTRDNQCQYIWGTSRLHPPAWWPYSVLFTALSSSLGQRYPARSAWKNSWEAFGSVSSQPQRMMMIQQKLWQTDTQVRSCHVNHSVFRWPWLLWDVTATCGHTAGCHGPYLTTHVIAWLAVCLAGLPGERSRLGFVSCCCCFVVIHCPS